MSIFALNMKFDIEQAGAAYVNREIMGKFEQKINRNQKYKLRTK